MKKLQAAAAGIVANLVAVEARGQQFQVDTSDIPTSSGYTENVDFGDVDNDGDWDAVFADGGDFGNQQSRIWINGGPGVNLGRFTNNTATQFPTVTRDSRDIEFVDFDNDADLDIYLSNTSQIANQTNLWWANMGGAQGGAIGFYQDQTAARWSGLGGAGSSIPPSQLIGGGFIDFSCDCDFGDVDNDGDIDLFHSTYGGAFGGNVPSRVFLNNGSGVFSEFNPSGFQLGGQNIVNGNPGLWCQGSQAANTTNTTGVSCDIASSALDIDLGDIDGDLDLDVLHGARQELPRMFRNRLQEEGSLAFRDMTGATFPAGYATGNGHYDQALGDFDADGALDIYGLNWQVSGSFNDITLRNNGDGTYCCTTVLPGSGSDDNEGDFFDFDNDGDLDLFIANFSGQERLYQNNGTGSYTLTSGVLPSDGSTSLDADTCDVDNDGDYDVFVANDGNQSEVYLRNGTTANDVTPPTLLRLEQAPDRSAGAAPTVVRVQVYDNASYYTTWYNPTHLEVRVNGGSTTSYPMMSSQGQIFRGAIPGNLVGTISYRAVSADKYGNTGASAFKSYVATGCAPPAIVSNPANVQTCSGTSAVFSVGATGSAPLTYQWRRNGVPLTNGGSVSGATTATLTIAPALPSNTGSYDCVVSNSCGTATSNAATLSMNTTDSDGDGTIDCVDGCPNDPLKIAPGICGCGVPDTDSDGDGTPNCNDGCPNDPLKVAPGICGCGVPDTDSDGDGTPNCHDGCPNDPLKVAPGVCGCGIPDTDSDGDGTPNCNDGCPSDPLKIAPGICGCGVPDTDSDGDGTPNCHDSCPNDPLKVAPGVCGCGVPDTDSDGDGTPNCNDGCPGDPLKIAPGICGCGVPDTDSDGDGTPNCHDGCPNDPLKVAPGVCGCGIPDTDSDGDGTPNCNDGCPSDPLKIAPGLCGCGVPDTDSDGDGTPNCHDGCPNDPLKVAPGVCGCGALDTDSDGDGTPNCNDGCPSDPLKIAPGACGCGVPDTDSDSDGTPNCNDGCPNDPLKIAPGACGCGVPDTDSDGDGTPNCNDGCPSDPLKVAPGVCGCGVLDTDNDSDGTPDCIDGCPSDPLKVAPGVCGCGVADTDSDGDGTPNCNDGCPFDPLKTAPAVCGCGASDADTDGDGVPDCNDNCDAIQNPLQEDCDGDNVGDACEIAAGAPDCNANGIPDSCDVTSGSSTDIDSNGVPDECGGAYAPFCFGDGSGTACPCGNNSPSGAGRGCVSSLGVGALISASGVARVSADTLVLTGSSMPNSFALYFQGTAQQNGGAGSVFGDGLRCAGGAVIRLATKNNVGGTSTYPQAGDLPISVKGAVPPTGGARHYQSWYRNAADFCSPATFNLTNGLQVAWAP